MPLFSFLKKKPLTKIGKVGKKDILLTHVYTDKSGNKYFEPKDGAEYPFNRLLQIQTYAKYAERKINSDSLIKMLDLIMDSASKGDHKNVIIMANDIKVAESLFCEKNTLLQLAASLYLINDERVDSWSDDYHNQKVKAIENDIEAMDFFLSVVYQRFKKSKEESPLQVIEYLMESLPIIDKITSHIRNFSPKQMKT